MPTSVSTHVSSLLGIVLSAVAVFHPGFTLTTTETGIVIAIGTGGALLLQALHINLKGTALKYLHEFQMQERRLAVMYQNVTKPLTPVTTAPVVAPVPVTVSTSVPKAAEGSNNVPMAASGS